MAALTTEEIDRARYHLGYPAVTTAASIQFGVPALAQTNFLFDNNVRKLLDSATDLVRQVVRVMDGIDLKLISAQDRLAASKLEDLTLRENEPDMLEAEYRRWGYRLADIIGCPIYPYSMRYRGGSANQARMIPVSNGF